MYLIFFSVQLIFHIHIMWPEDSCLDLEILAHLIHVPACGRGIGLNGL